MKSAPKVIVGICEKAKAVEAIAVVRNISLRFMMGS
jgi:hypothetical protein